MKKHTGICLMLAALILTALPTVGLASQDRERHGEHMGDSAPPCGRWNSRADWPDLSKEQRGALDKVSAEYREEAWKLRHELSAKELELSYLADNQQTKPSTISALVADIKSLEGQRHELRERYAATLQKDLSLEHDQAYALMHGWGRSDGYGHRGGRHSRR